MSVNRSEDLIVWSCNRTAVRLAARCGACGGQGRFFGPGEDSVDCEHCDGVGWFGLDPRQAVMAHPGSVEKVAMLTARYVAGVVLWNPQDGPEGPRRERTHAGRSGGDQPRRLGKSAEPATFADEELDVPVFSLAP